MVQHLHPLNCVSVSFQSCNLSKSQMAIFDKILPWICCFLHNSTVTFHFSLYIFKLHRYQPQMKSAANENGDSMYHIGLTEVTLTFNLLNVQPHVSHTMLCKKFHLAVTVVIASTNLEQQLACMWCTSRADFHEFGGEYIICEYMYITLLKSCQCQTDGELWTQAPERITTTRAGTRTKQESRTVRSQLHLYKLIGLPCMRL